MAWFFAFKPKGKYLYISFPIVQDAHVQILWRPPPGEPGFAVIPATDFYPVDSNIVFEETDNMVILSCNIYVYAIFIRE